MTSYVETGCTDKHQGPREDASVIIRLDGGPELIRCAEEA